MTLVHPPAIPSHPRLDPLIPFRTSVYNHVSPCGSSAIVDRAPFVITKRPQMPSTVTGTFIGLCKTFAAYPTTVHVCIWTSLTGLSQAAAVAQTPTLRNKTSDVLPPVILSVLLVASLVTVWWARRRATHRVTDRGAQTPSTPSQYRPLSIPSPVYLASRAPYAIFHMANALTVTERPRSHWTHPEIVLAGLSIILTVIGLVLGGLSLLYAQRAVQVSQA